MCDLSVRLFGKPQVQRDGQVLDGLNSRRVQEFFTYLLLHRPRSFARVALADLLWPQCSADQAMKHLRHALWQLKSVLGCEVLLVDAEWVSLDPGVDLWLDVYTFERAHTRLHSLPGRELDPEQAQALQKALELYRGDLLEGWYQDWCLLERERLQQMYLDLLAKHMAYCEASGHYAAGLAYGARALRCDVAQERIHRLLIRLHYRAGNRTAALRQYQRCVAFLRQELDVSPSARTLALYEQIRADQPLGSRVPFSKDDDRTSEQALPTLDQALKCLNQLQATVTHTQLQLQEVIQAVQIALNGRD
jgi:DNA-binding SARP family transcriptional activator